jgi:hypothetical protein
MLVRTFVALWLAAGAAATGSARAEEKPWPRPPAAPTTRSDDSAHNWSGFHAGVSGGLVRSRQPSAPGFLPPPLPGR